MPADATVLLVEEPPGGRAFDLVRTVTDAGWGHLVAEDRDRFRWLASVRRFSAVVARGRSVAWCKSILAGLDTSNGVPVVVILDSDADDDRMTVLDAGADAVLGGDCDERLLTSAVRAAIRRSGADAPVVRYLRAGGLSLDLWSHQVAAGGRCVALTPTEFGLLRLLMTRAQSMIPHHEIIRTVWSWNYADERNVLRIQINRLRSKLAACPGMPDCIRSVRGIGYSFTEPVSRHVDDAGNPGEAGQVFPRILRKLSGLLATATSREDACSTLVSAVVGHGLSDAAAVFACDAGADVLRLAAHAGGTPAWEEGVAAGIPLSGPYMASDTVRSRQVLYTVDLPAAAGKFGGTARLLRSARLSSHLSVPLADQHGVWGQVGFARRPDSAFTPAHCTVLEGTAYLLGMLHAG